MKRAITTAILLGFLAVSSGCVAVVGNRGQFGSSRQAVVVNDEVYVVNVCDGTVNRIDPHAIDTAPILVPDEDDD